MNLELIGMMIVIIFSFGMGLLNGYLHGYKKAKTGERRKKDRRHIKLK